MLIGQPSFIIDCYLSFQMVILQPLIRRAFTNSWNDYSSFINRLLGLQIEYLSCTIQPHFTAVVAWLPPSHILHQLALLCSCTGFAASLLRSCTSLCCCSIARGHYYFKHAQLLGTYTRYSIFFNSLHFYMLLRFCVTLRFLTNLFYSLHAHMVNAFMCICPTRTYIRPGCGNYRQRSLLLHAAPDLGGFFSRKVYGLSMDALTIYYLQPLGTTSKSALVLHTLY